MSLKQELQTWSDALVTFDKNDYHRAVELFQAMEPSSKIYFNIGLIYATRGHHDRAIEFFEKAIELDSYLAVAYFQAGVSQFLLGRYDDARREFDDAYLYLRNNEIIDYDQIGLKFQLYSCEVLFNRGLSLVNLGQLEVGLNDWKKALGQKYTQEHDVIDEAFLDNGKGYTVFSVSAGTIFRPSDSKLANLAQRDFLGKMTVIAATNASDLHVDFHPPDQSRSKAFSSNDPSTTSDSKSDSNNSATKTDQPPVLSRSQTAAARLEKSVDGKAQPLRRRTTIQEREKLKRSQTAPASTIDTASNRARHEPSPLPVVQDPRPPSPPDSIEELETIIFPMTNKPRPTTNGSNPSVLDSYYTEDPAVIDTVVKTKEEETLTPARRIPTSSLSEKRNRRLGLTIEVPPPPNKHNVSQGRPRNVAHSRSPSLPAPSSPRIVVPHSRSASLSSARPTTSIDHHALATRPPVGLKSSSRYRKPPPALRQDSSSSSSGSSSNPILVLTPVQEDLPINDTIEPKVQQQSSPGLAYLQSPESVQVVSIETKVRIKLQFRDDLRAMIIPNILQLPAFVERVKVKLDSFSNLSLKYRDIDNCFISIVDDEDWQSALETALECKNKNGDGKLEVLVNETD